ncbi:MAG: hypothetical protein ACI9N9_000017 [Enterobacterales bacterium]|jgi:hypothetical protein
MTVLEEFLKQIVLKQVKGLVYILPVITDKQIKEALEKERRQVINASMKWYEGVNDLAGEQYYNELKNLP